MRMAGRKLLLTCMTDAYWLFCPAAIKTRFYYPRLILLLVSVLVFAPAGAADDIAEQTEKLQQLQKHIQGIKTELESMQGQRDTTQVKL